MVVVVTVQVAPVRDSKLYLSPFLSRLPSEMPLSLLLDRGTPEAQGAR